MSSPLTSGPSREPPHEEAPRDDEPARAAPEPSEPAPEPGETAPPRRRKRSRRRRFILRPAVWLLVLALVLVGAIVLYLGSEAGKRRVADFLVTRLSEYLGRPVTVESVDYGLAPPWDVRIHGLVVPGPEGDERPVLEVGTLVLSARFEGLFSPVLRVEQVAIVDPTLYVRFEEDGSTNLPDLPEGRETRRRLDMELGHLLVDGGQIVVDELSLPLEIDAEGVRARLASEEGFARLGSEGLELTGWLAAEEARIDLPDAEPWTGALAVKADVSADALVLRSGRLAGRDLDARLAGVLTWGEETSIEVEIDARGDAALANRLGYLEAEVAGPFRFDGGFAWTPERWGYEGTLTSSELTLLGRTFTGVEARLDGGPEALAVGLERAGYASGTLSGTLDLDLAAEPAAAELDLELAGLSLARLLEDQEIGLRNLAGGVSGSVEYRFTTEAPLAGSGSGRLELASVGRPGDGLPLSGTVPFTVSDGVVESDAVRLEAPGQRIAASGRLDLEEAAGELDFRLDTSDLGRLAGVLPAASETPRPGWLPSAGSGVVEGEIAFTSDRLAGDLSADLENLAAPLLAADAVDLTLRDATLRLGGDAVAGRVEGGLDLAASGLVLRDTPQGDVSIARLDATARGASLAGEELTLAGLEGELSEVSGAELRLARGTVTAETLSVGPAGSRFDDLTARLDDAEVGGVQVASLDLSAADARLAEGSLVGRFDARAEEIVGPGYRITELDASGRLLPGRVEGLSLTAREEGGSLVLAGSLDFPENLGRLGEAFEPGARGEEGLLSAPFLEDADLSGRLVSWPASTLAAFLPVEVEGDLSGEIEIRGSGGEVTGTASLASDGPLVVDEHRLDRAEVDLALDGSRLEIERALVRAPSGRIELAGAYDLATRRFDLSLDAPELDLAASPLAELIPSELAGRASLELEIGGTPESPTGVARLTARGLEIAGRDLGGEGETALNARWEDGRLDVDGSLLGLVDVSGGGVLGRERSDVTLTVASDRIRDLVDLVSESPLVPPVEGSFVATIEADGPMGDLLAGGIEIEVPTLSLDYEGHHVENLEPIVATVSDERVAIESFFVGTPGGDDELFVTGTVGLEGERPLDLRLQSEIDASWAELLVPQVDLEGELTALATVGGTLEAPVVNGQAAIDRGRAILAGFPHALSDMEALVFFDRDEIVIDGLTGELGGGRVRVAGRADFPRPGEELSYRLQAAGDGVTVRWPEGWVVRADAEITLASLPGGERQLKGVVELDRAFYLEDVPVGFGQLLQSAFERERLEVGETDETLAATRLALAIEGDEALRVRNNLADLEGDIDLTVRGTLAQPVVFGQVELEPGGEIVFRDAEYEVERGLLTFSNPYEIEPVIDLVATTEVSRYDIRLSLSGTLERLEASFTSDPALSDLEVLSVLATGSPLSAEGDPTAAFSAEDFLLGQAAGVISERVNTLFGFDKLSIAPVAGSDSLAALGVTIEKRLSSDIYVTYSNQASVEGDVIQLAWEVSDVLTLLLTREGDGSFAVDAQWERSF